MDSQIQKVSKWLGSGSINIFGMPFAGKDTQGHKLADLFDGVFISGGDLLRNYHDQELIKKLMSTGDQWPTDLYLKIVLPYLLKPELKAKPLILSTVGRLHGEEPVIMKATADSGHHMKAVISLILTEADVWQRYEEAKVDKDRGNRLDDKRDVLANRLKKFKIDTVPVIEFYRDKGLLIEIDGSPPCEEVTKEIITRLSNLTS